MSIKNKRSSSTTSRNFIFQLLSKYDNVIVMSTAPAAVRDSGPVHTIDTPVESQEASSAPAPGPRHSEQRSTTFNLDDLSGSDSRYLFKTKRNQKNSKVCFNNFSLSIIPKRVIRNKLSLNKKKKKMDVTATKEQKQQQQSETQLVTNDLTATERKKQQQQQTPLTTNDLTAAEKKKQQQQQQSSPLAASNLPQDLVSSPIAAVEPEKEKEPMKQRFMSQMRESLSRLKKLEDDLAATVIYNLFYVIKNAYSNNVSFPIGMH